jgi:hypothetical protein
MLRCEPAITPRDRRGSRIAAKHGEFARYRVGSFVARSLLDARAMLRRTFLFTAAIAVLTALGCSSSYMRPAEGPQTIAPAEDVATVVFVRPSAFAAAVHPTILDENGAFLGEAEASSHFVARVRPGEHMFFVWAENTGPIHASVVAGRVYFVEVSMKMGFATARAHLLAITPRSEQWERVREWIDDTKPIVADLDGGNRYLAERRDDVRERIGRAHEAFAEMDGEERENRTLRPNDGIIAALRQ